MDRFDPNTWTAEYVRKNSDDCLRFIVQTNDTVVERLKANDPAAAVAGLDRVLNGLITMLNAGYGDLRSYISLLSFAEGEILAFSDFSAYGTVNRDVQTQRAAALFSDAADFAATESFRETAKSIASQLKNGKNKKYIQDDAGIAMPSSAIEDIENVTNKLLRQIGQIAPSASSVAPQQTKKSKKGIVIAVITVIIAFVVITLFNSKGEQKFETEPAKAPVNKTSSTNDKGSQEEELVFSDYINYDYNKAADVFREKGIDVEVSFEETDSYSPDCIIRIDEISDNKVRFVVAQAVKIPKLTHNRAFDLVSYENDLAFMTYYFRAKGILDETDIYTVNLGVQEYVQLVDYQYATGINNTDDLREYLSQDFTSNYIDTQVFGEYCREKWVSANGKLYFEPNWAAGSCDMLESSLSIEELSEGRYRVLCAYDLPGNSEDSPECNEYIIVYDNGAYKVDSITY